MMPAATPPPNDAPPQDHQPLDIRRLRIGRGPAPFMNILLTSSLLAVAFGLVCAVFYVWSYREVFFPGSTLTFGQAWLSYMAASFPWFFLGRAILVAAHLLRDAQRHNARALGKSIARALRATPSRQVLDDQANGDDLRGDD